MTKVLLRRDDVPSFDQYPFCLPAVRTLSSLTLHPKVTFLVGENGTGKSTLLEAIAVAWGLNAEGGSKNFNFATKRTHSMLSDYLTLVRTPARAKDSFFLRAESYYNVATEMDDNLGADLAVQHYGGRSLHEQSHGESFLALVLHRFWGNGFYVLDEPEAALSPTRQLALLRRVHELAQGGSQFVIATHSPILMAYPEAQVMELSEEGARPISYQETEHYIVTRQFLNNPEGVLRTLLEDR